MMYVQTVFVLLFLLQACEPAAAQTPGPAEAEAPGILQRISDRVGEARTKIRSLREVLFEFAGTYYEDHIQPTADSYAEWASNIGSSLRERIWTTIDDYTPFTN